MDESVRDERTLQRRGSMLGNKILDPVLWATETNDTDARLVDWNTDVLMSLLTSVVASREDDQAAEQAMEPMQSSWKQGIPLKEVALVLQMPAFEDREERKVDLPEVVREELRDYVEAIASAYQRTCTKARQIFHTVMLPHRKH